MFMTRPRVLIAPALTMALTMAMALLSPAPALAQDPTGASQNRAAQEEHARQQNYESYRREEAQRAQDGQRATNNDYAGPPAVAVSYNLTVAWHPDAHDVFVATRQPTYQAANTAAMDACTAFMRRDGCEWGAGARSGVIAVARDQDLYFHAGSGANRADAERQAMSKCESVAPPCQLFKAFHSDQALQTPGQPPNLYVPVASSELFRRYGVMVGLGDDDETDGQRMLWLATGFASFAEAEQAGLSACGQATGQACSALNSGADNFLGTYVTSQGAVLNVRGPTEPGVRDFVPRHCRESGFGTCRITNIFDVREQAVYAIHGGG